MFVYISGLGALIVRNKSAHVLEKRYFGGGTVNIAVPAAMFHVKRAKLHERYCGQQIFTLASVIQHNSDATSKRRLNLNFIAFSQV